MRAERFGALTVAFTFRLKAWTNKLTSLASKYLAKSLLAVFTKGIYLAT